MIARQKAEAIFKWTYHTEDGDLTTETVNLGMVRLFTTESSFVFGLWKSFDVRTFHEWK